MAESAEFVAQITRCQRRLHSFILSLVWNPAEQRSLIARRYQPDGSVNAIATAGGTTPKAISDRLRRIRHTLLQCVQKKLREATA